MSTDKGFGEQSHYTNPLYKSDPAYFLNESSMRAGNMIKNTNLPINNPQEADSDESKISIHSLEDALSRCQELGMRISPQRRYILELLWQTQEHLSAREIYDCLNKQGKEIGHTSVYQNLEALSSQGIIECVERCDGRLYGNLSESHSHVNCLDTQQIIDIHLQLPEDLIQKIEMQTGVKITDYRVDFYGYRNPKNS